MTKAKNKIATPLTKEEKKIIDKILQTHTQPKFLELVNDKLDSIWEKKFSIGIILRMLRSGEISPNTRAKFVKAWIFPDPLKDIIEDCEDK